MLFSIFHVKPTPNCNHNFATLFCREYFKLLTNSPQRDEAYFQLPYPLIFMYFNLREIFSQQVIFHKSFTYNCLYFLTEIYLRVLKEMKCTVELIKSASSHSKTNVFQPIVGKYTEGYIYDTAKTHKEGNPLRPIISLIPTPV